MSTLGTPHRPNPPTARDAPSPMSATASAALRTTLSIASVLVCRRHVHPAAVGAGHGPDPTARRDVDRCARGTSSGARAWGAATPRGSPRLPGGGPSLVAVAGDRRAARTIQEAPPMPDPGDRVDAS
ncbi:hypothetical protein GCM10027194_19140 [Thalassiella azotivora]